MKALLLCTVVGLWVLILWQHWHLYARHMANGRRWWWVLVVASCGWGMLIWRISTRWQNEFSVTWLFLGSLVCAVIAALASGKMTLSQAAKNKRSEVK